MQSEKYNLNKEDLKKIAKGAGIACAGALLTYIGQNLTNMNFGEYTPVIVALASILVNAGLKFVSGK